MNDVVQVHGVGYIVRSASVPGAWRLVQGANCSCPAGQEHMRCRHVRAVTEFCREQDRLHRRPTPPPNVAAICD